MAAAPSHDMPGFPLSYLRNGMLAVMVALVTGFLGIFFAVLTDVDEDTHIGPCEWGIGGCSTISCIAGTYKPQVYTYMMVMLVLSAVLGVTLLEASRAATDADAAVDDVESKKVRRWQQIVITVAQIFMSLIVLTGIFPAEYATNPEESLTLVPDTQTEDIASARFKFYGKLHVTGVVMLLVPFLLSTMFFTSLEVLPHCPLTRGVTAAPLAIPGDPACVRGDKYRLDPGSACVPVLSDSSGYARLLRTTLDKPHRLCEVAAAQTFPLFATCLATSA